MYFRFFVAAFLFWYQSFLSLFQFLARGFFRSLYSVYRRNFGSHQSKCWCLHRGSNEDIFCVRYCVNIPRLAHTIYLCFCIKLRMLFTSPKPYLTRIAEQQNVCNVLHCLISLIGFVSPFVCWYNYQH